MQRSFTDTEVFEDVAEDFVGGDFARDFAQVVEGFADVLGKQVGGERAGEAFGYTCEALGGRTKGVVVADVGDQHILVFEAPYVDDIKQEGGEAFNVLLFFC